MTVLDAYSAPRVSTGLTSGIDSSLTIAYCLTVRSIREGLRRGDFHVSGEQWPIFLYHNHEYDSDDPWKGLLRSSLLVSVSSLSLQ
jgi:hypothetical protein